MAAATYVYQINVLPSRSSSTDQVVNNQVPAILDSF